MLTSENVQNSYVQSTSTHFCTNVQILKRHKITLYDTDTLGQGVILDPWPYLVCRKGLNIFRRVIVLNLKISFQVREIEFAGTFMVRQGHVARLLARLLQCAAGGSRARSLPLPRIVRTERERVISTAVVGLLFIEPGLFWIVPLNIQNSNLNSSVEYSN